MRRLLCLAALVAAPAVADTVLVENRVREPFTMMGQSQPREETTVETWFGDGVLRRDEGSTTFLLDTKAQRLVILDHEAKTASTLDLPIDLEQLMPAEMQPMMKQMREAMKMEATVEKTEETAKVAGFEARRVNITVTSATGMRSEMAVWLASGLGVDSEAFRTAARAMASLQPAAESWIEKLLELEGYPVKTDTTMTMMGSTMVSHEELVRKEERDAPADWYAIPSQYQTKKFNPMEMMGGPGPGR